jgi:hypothetical protein
MTHHGRMTRVARTASTKHGIRQSMRSIFSPSPIRSIVFVLIFACASAAHAQLLVEQWTHVSQQLSAQQVAPHQLFSHAAATTTGAMTSAAPFGAIDFTPHATQPGLVYDIQPPEYTCGTCHGFASGDPDTASQWRPFSTWSGSMMANATRDPLFFAALDIANNDVPGVGDYCLRCHTPRGWLMGHVVKPGFGPPNDPVQGAAACLLNGTYDAPDDSNSDMGGVTCHFCHRMMPTGPDGEPGYTENGNAWVDDVSCANTGGGPPCRRGPYAYTDGTTPPPHEWEYSEYHTQSAICGTCHNVSSPDTDQGTLKTLKLNDGTDTGHPFPIERTFTEWQQSQYAQTPETICQNCHMPTTEDADATACSMRQNNRTGNMPVHEFVGGNTWVPTIIKGEYGPGLETSGTNREESLDQTVAWAREMLGTAASVDATIQDYTPPTGSAAGSLALAVRITNLTGHKLPTGYAEGRRMWLNVQVRDASGALVFESGAYNAASAELSEDAQARVYEVLQGIFNQQGTSACDIADAGGDPMFHFVLNDCIAKDTRIPPLGFTPATAGDPNGYDLRPVGVDYPETTPGSGVLVNYDTAPYSVPVPAGTVGPLTATARLYYQTASNHYMRFLRDEAVANDFPGENDMCAANTQYRPFTVGPQAKSRGQFAFDMWAGDRLFGNGFDDDQPAPPLGGYGMSPPELMQTGAATTQ